MFHEWIALIVFLLFSFAGIGLTMVGIGGTFLVVLGALLFNLITWSMEISLTTLAVIAGLAILGELLEWVITYYGVKINGVSRHGLWGTIIGAIIGGSLLSVIPVVGTIIGIILGAIIGAFLGEYRHTRNAEKAWKAAKAAFIGRIFIIITKTIIALIQLVIVLKAI